MRSLSELRRWSKEWKLKADIYRLEAARLLERAQEAEANAAGIDRDIEELEREEAGG